MKRRALLSAGLGALAGCGAGERENRSWELRYRVSVRVVADGRVRSNSSTFRSVYRRIDNGERGLAGARLGARTWGEAIAVPMGDHGWLVGALGQVSGIDTDRTLSLSGPLALTGLLPTPERDDFSALVSGRLYERVRELEGEHPAPAHLWPVFLAFSDIEDLATVRLVSVPGARYSTGSNIAVTSLQGAFGNNVRVESVTIEMTEEPVTRHLHTLAPWLSELRRRRSTLAVRGVEPPLSQTLRYRNFILTGDGE